MTPTDAPCETAYYYPEPYWLAQEGGWIKSLLLFFDEVAILLPSYMRGRNVLADPTLAAPLRDEGLLRVLEPESFLSDGSPVPAALGALGAGLRMLPSRATGSAYSYLFRARRELS